MSVERDVEPGQRAPELAAAGFSRPALSEVAPAETASTRAASNHVASTHVTLTEMALTDVTLTDTALTGMAPGGLGPHGLGPHGLGPHGLGAIEDPSTNVVRLVAVDDLPSPGPDTGAKERTIADAGAVHVPVDAWELVRRTQDGDAEAFGLLYDRYVDVVYRFVYYRIGDRTQAEDLTSETFLRALRRISTVHEQGRDIGAWLVTIARNLMLDHVKSAQYRLCVPTEEIVEAHLEQAGDTTEAAVLAGLDQRALLEAVRLLSPEQQESIVLRFFQGLSLAETAEIMGRNAGAVKALQHRAIKQLHVLLSTPASKPATTDAAEVPERDRPRRRSSRAPPVAEAATSVRKRYRTRNRRNH